MFVSEAVMETGRVFSKKARQAKTADITGRRPVSPVKEVATSRFGMRDHSFIVLYKILNLHASLATKSTNPVDTTSSLG